MEMAAKVTHNVISPYTLTCKEKIALALEATFLAYKKKGDLLRPLELNFIIRGKVRDYILKEKNANSAIEAYIERLYATTVTDFEEEELYNSILDTASKLFSKKDFSILLAWLNEEKLCGAKRVRVHRMISKLKEIYE